MKIETINGIPFKIDSAKKMKHKDFDNAYGHRFKRVEMLDDTWDKLQKAAGKTKSESSKKKDTEPSKDKMSND